MSRERGYAQQAQDPAGGIVEQRNKQAKDSVEQQQPRCGQHRHPFGVADCPNLGRLLANHDMQRRNHDKCDDGAKRVCHRFDPLRGQQ